MNIDAESQDILKGRQLAWARVVWIVIALTMFGVVIASWPPYVRLLHTVCETCPMTPAYAETLQAIGVSTEQWAVSNIIPKIIVYLGWMGMGIVIFLFKPNDRRALLFSALLIMTGAGFGGTISLLSNHVPAWVWVSNIITFATFPCFVGLIFLFPNSKFNPRGLAWLLGVLTVLFSPILIQDLDFPVAYNFIGGIGSVSFVISCVVVPVYRYRRVMTFTERLQTRWVIFGIVLAMVGIATTLVSAGSASCDSDNPTLYCDVVQSIGYNLSPLMIPIFIGIAILRSRLWDIDLIIRRTLQYSVLSGLLALTYFGSVVALQRIFTALTGQGQNQLVAVLSTLAIAALFNPIRRRVQDVIDRRFYRKKYDAAKVIAEFGATCRDETDLDKLTESLIAVVQETMQPESVSLWLKPTAERARRRITAADGDQRPVVSDQEGK